MNDEQLYNKLADILNALPDIDPHDDEAWMTDRCFPKFKEFVASEHARIRDACHKMLRNPPELAENPKEIKEVWKLGYECGLSDVIKALGESLES